MKHFEGLIEDRKIFLEQLYNLVKNQFKAQERLTGKIEEIIEILDNDPDYIQRIFIDAPWGMGKTYFAKAFEEKVASRKDVDGLEVIKINAWETDFYSDPMKSLISELTEFSAMKLETFEKSKQVIGNIGRLIALKSIEKILPKNSEVNFEDLKSVFDLGNKEIAEYKSYKSAVKNLKKNLSQDINKKIVLIDELDRCKPSYAIELLETVKHLFGVKNLIFIFLVNKAQLGEIASTFGLQDDKKDEYFEKFFDLELKLPEINYQELIDKEYKKSLNLDVENEEVQRDNFINYTFIEIFKANYAKDFMSARKFSKIFKKFKLLISTLSDEEKSYYFLIIYLGIVFFQKEYLPKGDSRVERIENIFNKTFFIGEKIKKEYSHLGTLYLTYKLIILERKGMIYNSENIRRYVIIIERTSNRDLINFEYNDSITIKKVLINKLGTSFVNLPLTIFTKDELEKYLLSRRVFGENKNEVSLGIVDEWAERKCNFLNNVIENVLEKE